MLRRHSTVRGRPRIEIAILASVGYPTDSCALPSVIFSPCGFSSVLRCGQRCDDPCRTSPRATNKAAPMAAAALENQWHASFTRALPHPLARSARGPCAANWSGSKNRVFGDGVARNVRGCSMLRDRPPVSLSMK